MARHKVESYDGLHFTPYKITLLKIFGLAFELVLKKMDLQ